MKPEHVEILKTLNLTTIESKVYLTLLEIGKSLAGTIAERANIHRRNVYDALESLLEKGLVNYIIANNRKYWNCATPERIKIMLDEKKASVVDIMPELLVKFNTLKPKQRIEVFEGIGGMKTFYDDILKSKKEIMILFATGNAYLRMPNYMKKWDSILKTEKIRQKILLNHNAPKDPYTNVKYAEIRILPRNFTSPTQIFIYGNKSAVAIWSEEPVAILISNEEITNGFKNYFQFLWEINKTV